MKNFGIVVLGFILIFSTTSCKNMKKVPPKFEGPDEIVIKVCCD